jgi:hypothetical protein
MTLLYQVHGGPGQPATFLMHCPSCGGTIGVQNVKSKKNARRPPMVVLNPVEDGAKIRVPKPAPDQLEVVRETFDPEKLRKRIMGVVKLPVPINKKKE